MNEIEEQIRERLSGLVSGTLDVDAVADWAVQLKERDDPAWADDRLWSALDKLSMADSRTGPEDFLYGRDDFIDWLNDFDAGIA